MVGWLQRVIQENGPTGNSKFLATMFYKGNNRHKSSYISNTIIINSKWSQILHISYVPSWANTEISPLLTVFILFQVHNPYIYSSMKTVSSQCMEWKGSLQGRCMTCKQDFGRNVENYVSLSGTRILT